MYGYFEQIKHLFIGQFACHILGHKLIFQAIVYQIVGAYTSFYQTSDFIGHTSIKASLQAFGDASATVFYVNLHAHYHSVLYWMWFCLHLLLGMLLIVVLYLNGADGTLARIHVGGVVQALHLA